MAHHLSEILLGQSLLYLFIYPYLSDTHTLIFFFFHPHSNFSFLNILITLWTKIEQIISTTLLFLAIKVLKSIFS